MDNLVARVNDNCKYRYRFVQDDDGKWAIGESRFGMIYEKHPKKQDKGLMHLMEHKAYCAVVDFHYEEKMYPKEIIVTANDENSIQTQAIYFYG